MMLLIKVDLLVSSNIFNMFKKQTSRKNVDGKTRQIYMLSDKHLVVFGNKFECAVVKTTSSTVILRICI